MTRREILGAALAAGKPLTAAGEQPAPGFWKSRLTDVQEAVAGLKKGKSEILGKSAGQREIYLVAYGRKDQLSSTANYNSACAARNPAAYRAKDGNQKPVVLFLGPVHGQEVEGVAGLVNLLAVAETGQDLRKRSWPVLVERLSQCRVLIVPVGNPDGRARCPNDSWVGLESSVNERIGMGTRPDGRNYVWPGVKAFHPMRAPFVGRLGAYFNDAGVNLMHDDWLNPMAAETHAFLKLAIAEAPDFIAVLHSHGVAPSIEPTDYVPRTIKQTIQEFSQRLYARYDGAGLPHQPKPTLVQEDGVTFPPPSFNLASALHHACGAVSMVHETPAGIKPYVQVTHDQILDIEMLLYEELLGFALEHRTRWTQNRG